MVRPIGILTLVLISTFFGTGILAFSSISTALRFVKLNVESLDLKLLILLVLIINLRLKESFHIEHLKPVNLTSKSSMLYIFKLLFTSVVCLVFFSYYWLILLHLVLNFKFLLTVVVRSVFFHIIG